MARKAGTATPRKKQAAKKRAVVADKPNSPARRRANKAGDAIGLKGLRQKIGGRMKKIDGI